MNRLVGVILLVSIMLSPLSYSAEVRILCEDEMYPFSWQENGEPKGVVVEMVQSMLDDMGKQNPIEIYPWNRVYKLGLTSPYTMICTMAKTAERSPQFKWVGEVFSSPPVLLALKGREDIDIESFQDLKNYTIGTHRGSFREKYLVARGLYLEKHLFSENSNSSNYKKLKKGRIDLWSISLLLAYQILLEQDENLDEKLRIVYTLDELPQGQHMAFQLSTPDDLVEQYREALRNIKENGTHEAIVNKYFRR
ncbi:substrate-binding periplasmic protein [Vibrio sonorensis]|uniref:substrate-binding periplasmic protein n=1 Tax=Vibrio sonorensis TaxID=1004316 RepID=UPI0008D9C335|nr:ABC transporter substrate-binding protein [Vibrio sonorensis]